jgi:hypothetical protein
MDLEIEVAKFLEGCVMPVPDGKGVPFNLEGIELLARCVGRGLWVGVGGYFPQQIRAMANSERYCDLTGKGYGKRCWI